MGRLVRYSAFAALAALPLTAAKCQPNVVQSLAPETASATSVTITSDCHSVHFELNLEPDHLYYLEYGSAPPYGAITDDNGHYETTQSTAETGDWTAAVSDSVGGARIHSESFHCAATCG